MGYHLRRKLREALGPGVTGLQRAVALEIADDANEETRKSWVSLEDLARWTGAKDAVVVRNALKRLAVAGWEFRIPIGQGKDGRTLYAVPGTRMTFVVPPFQEVATATPPNQQGVAPAPSEGATATPRTPEGVAPAHSEGAGAHSEGAGATPFSSYPSAPHEEEDAVGRGGATATPSVPVREITAEDKIEFGNFWTLHPKSKDQEKTRKLWVTAVQSGAEPKQITAAAVAYAREKAGQEFRYIRTSHSWLEARGWLDSYEPEPTGKPNLKAVDGKGGHRPFQLPEDRSAYANGF